MKKQVLTCGLFALSAVSGTIGALTKNSNAKWSLIGLSGLSGASALGMFASDHFKKSFEETSKEVEKTEKILENSGIDTTILTGNEFTQQTEKGESSEEVKTPFGLTLYRQFHKDLPDDQMEITSHYLNTLHVGQLGSKLVIAIALPRTAKNEKSSGLTARDVFSYFKEELSSLLCDGEDENYAQGLPLGIERSDLTIYSKGYEVRLTDDSLKQYSTIEKGEQSTKDYVDMLAKINAAWKNNPSFRKEKTDQGVVGYEQYLICEIPTYNNPNSILKGINISGAMLVIREMMGTEYYIKTDGGNSLSFEFNHIQFHRELDFSTALDYNETDHCIDEIDL